MNKGIGSIVNHEWNVSISRAESKFWLRCKHNSLPLEIWLLFVTAHTKDRPDLHMERSLYQEQMSNQLIITLLWSNALWLVQTSHMTLKIQSKCFIRKKSKSFDPFYWESKTLLTSVHVPNLKANSLASCLLLR